MTLLPRAVINGVTRLGWLLLVAALTSCRAHGPGAELLGQATEIEFTAVDGREVDLSKLRGKVVLVDFYATWCPPCMREAPLIKETYQKLHSRGFEIIGISFDEKKQDLLSFLTESKIEWPQYFESTGGVNQFGRRFRIEEIPVLWLFDKGGKLRYIDATDNLGAKAEKLLSENTR